MLEISISVEFTNGAKSSECYFANRRMVSRRTYEKKRIAYPDMPPADTAIEDFSGDLLRLVAQEKKQIAARRKANTPDAERALTNDQFCLDLMSRGKCVDASDWIREQGRRTLGERTPAGSRKLIDRFASLGCPKVYACEIEVEDEGDENTGHLVVELPGNEPMRAKTQKAIHRLASQQGLQGDPDDGQRFAYIKLD